MPDKFDIVQCMVRRSHMMAENYSFSVILEPQEGGYHTLHGGLQSWSGV
jgi:hypothetical protein